MIIHLQEICELFSKYNQLWYSVKSINHTIKSIIHKLKSLKNEKYSDEWHENNIKYLKFKKIYKFYFSEYSNIECKIEDKVIELSDIIINRRIVLNSFEDCDSDILYTRQYLDD